MNNEDYWFEQWKKSYQAVIDAYHVYDGFGIDEKPKHTLSEQDVAVIFNYYKAVLNARFIAEHIIDTFGNSEPIRKEKERCIDPTVKNLESRLAWHIWTVKEDHQMAAIENEIKKDPRG